jgi:hypothetical protein
MQAEGSQLAQIAPTCPYRYTGAAVKRYAPA